MYSGPELFAVSGEHELEEFGDGFCILLDLLLCVGVHNGETGVYVPLVRVYAEGDVLLDILNAPDIAARFPRELIVRRPSCAHTEEGGMGDSLRICCDAVVLLGGEVDVLRSEAGHYTLDEVEVIVGCAMLDQDQRLALWINSRAVEGMHRDDADVFGQVLFEGIDLWCFA